EEEEDDGSSSDGPLPPAVIVRLSSAESIEQEGEGEGNANEDEQSSESPAGLEIFNEDGDAHGDVMDVDDGGNSNSDKIISAARGRSSEAPIVTSRIGKGGFEVLSGGDDGDGGGGGWMMMPFATSSFEEEGTTLEMEATTSKPKEEAIGAGAREEDSKARDGRGKGGDGKRIAKAAVKEELSALELATEGLGNDGKGSSSVDEENRSSPSREIGTPTVSMSALDMMPFSSGGDVGGLPSSPQGQGHAEGALTKGGSIASSGATGAGTG
ncbi:unnamed protein product, partial [Choristocarpus tenellus]